MTRLNGFRLNGFRLNGFRQYDIRLDFFRQYDCDQIVNCTLYDHIRNYYKQNDSI
jgi:hypothetical protein